MPFDIGPETLVPRGAANMLRLADHLERVRPERYNHDEWCGTTACAMGHAALSRLFDFTFDEGYRSWDNGRSILGFRRAGSKRSIDPITLAMETFEIGTQTAEWVFGFDERPRGFVGPDHIATREEVISVLRELAQHKIMKAQEENARALRR